MSDTKVFKLVDLPDYHYPIGLACPTCFKPLTSRKKRDGRCDECLHSRDLLPVNYKRRPKRKDQEDDEFALPYDEYDE